MKIAQGHLFSVRFPMEWTAFFLALALEVPLLFFSGLSIKITMGVCRDTILCVAVAVLCGLSRKFQRFSAGGEFLALCFLSSYVFAVATYLAAFTALPLVDSRLVAFDRHIGFDWLPVFQWLQSYPWLISILGFCYDSFLWQLIVFSWLFADIGFLGRMREYFWLMICTSILTTLVFCLFPSLGPFSIYGIADSRAVNLHGAANYLKDLIPLRMGAKHGFALSAMKGIVNFPSFHTVLAISLMYCFRGVRLIYPAILLVNMGLLLAIPVLGGHYLADMVAGAGVALLGILAVRRLGFVSVIDGDSSAPSDIGRLLAPAGMFTRQEFSSSRYKA